MKIFKDYSFIRGICHNPDLNFSQKKLERELEFCKRLKINSIRFWLLQLEYEKNPNEYLNTVGEFIDICWTYHISCMPIFWNGNIIKQFIPPTEEEYTKAAVYAKAVIDRFGKHEGLLIWDVINEPFCNDFIYMATKEEAEGRYMSLRNHVRRLCNIIRDLDQTNGITVGHEQVNHCESSEDLVDVISYHDYSSTRREIENNILAAKEIGHRRGKPVLNTETGCVGRANPYAVEIELLDKHDIGWYLFNLITEGFWGDIHGLVYPDGTIRDPETIAALYGFYRNRTEKRIKANPNKEGHAYKAIKAVEDALRIEPSELFMSKPKTTDDILDAVEYCVNLLESAEMVPMWDLPSARIESWRKQPIDERDNDIIRKFAYDMARLVRENCLIL